MMCQIEKILEPEKCLNIIRKKLMEENLLCDYSNIEYKIVPINEVNGYLGQYFRLETSILQLDSPKNRKNISFFIKSQPPKGTNQYFVVCNSGMFNREIRLYCQIFPLILNHSDREYLPRCYFGLEDNVLVLEDLVARGFKVSADKLNTLDFEHCEMVMEKLGKFHAKTMIYEEKNKKTLLDYCREREIIIRSYDTSPPPVFTFGVNCALCVIDCLPGLDSRIRNDFKVLFNKTQSKLHEMLLPSQEYRNVQIHGDLWINNLMFKYNDDGKPMQCYLIDFQITRYAPPAYDILTFLYHCTGREMRAKNSGILLEKYYESLRRTLEEVDMDVSKVLPWQDFMKSIAVFKIYSLIRVIIAQPITLIVDKTRNQSSSIQLWEDLSDDILSFYSKQFQDNERFKNRILDTVLSLHEFL